MSPRMAAVASPGRGETLGQIHLTAERSHDRAAVVRRWSGDRWEETPDWRFHRHVLRIALYLDERVGLREGDRVAIVAPLGTEALVADWASVSLGLATVAIDPDATLPQLTAVWRRIAPRVAFVAGDAADRVSQMPSGTGPERVIVLGGPARTGRDASFSEALDLGGTLDTAERANAFRARVRDVSPDRPMVGFAEHDGAWRFMSQRDVVARLRRRWSSAPPRKGDLAPAPCGTPTLKERIELYGFVGDGLTCTVLPTRDDRNTRNANAGGRP